MKPRCIYDLPGLAFMLCLPYTEFAKHHTCLTGL